MQGIHCHIRREGSPVHGDPNPARSAPSTAPLLDNLLRADGILPSQASSYALPAESSSAAPLATPIKKEVLTFQHLAVNKLPTKPIALDTLSPPSAKKSRLSEHLLNPDRVPGLPLTDAIGGDDDGDPMPPVAWWHWMS